MFFGCGESSPPVYICDCRMRPYDLPVPSVTRGENYKFSSHQGGACDRCRTNISRAQENGAPEFRRHLYALELGSAANQNDNIANSSGLI